MRDYLVKECAEGRVVRPLEPGVFPMVHVSCFGVTLKYSAVDCGPLITSVNDGIREELCTLTYVSVDDAARAMVEK